LADPWNLTGSGRMRRDRDMQASAKLPASAQSPSWEYSNLGSKPNSKQRQSQYDELNVQELLHGLEAESNLQAERAEHDRFASSESSDPETVCHGCQRKNPAGQRFCGYCGTRLADPEPPMPERAREAWPFRPADEHAASNSMNDELDRELHEDDEGRDRQRAAWPGMSSGMSSEENARAGEDELQFLRYRVASSAWENSHRGWKIVLAVLALAAAGYAGYRWFLKPPVAKYSAAPLPAEIQEAPGAEEPPDAHLPEPAQPGPPAQSPPQAQAAPDTSASDIAVQHPQAKTEGKTEAKAATPPEQRSPSHISVGDSNDEAKTPPTKNETPAGNPAIPVEGGQQELATAERYLYGVGAPRDSAEAAKWLWRAVGKQNGRAILLLSDLYAKGEGVPRNCDQARLLLMTAFKKKVPGSTLQLEKLHVSGCQ